MSRAARIPFGAPVAARSARQDARRPRGVVSRAGSGAAAAAASQATRNRPGVLVVICLAAAPALLAPAGDAHAQSRIGRLFSTPEQRAELDWLRENSGAGEVAAPAPDPPARESLSGTERETPALAAKLNGIIVRDDGYRVAWIDGAETPAGSSTPAGVRVESERTPGGRLRVRLSLGRTTAVLVPGQSIDADGTVRNAYERRPAALAAGTTGEGYRTRERPAASSRSPEMR